MIALSRVCKLIGDIATTDAEEVFTKGSPELGEQPETFYSVPLKLYNVEIPMLISGYRLSLIQQGHVEVTGAVMSIHKRKKLPKFYVYVNNIEQTEPDVLPTNIVSFVGTITKVRPLTQDDAGRDVFTLIISDLSPLGKVSILYVALRGPIARRFANLEKGVKICGEGYLRHYKSTYEIYATDLQLL